MKHVPTIAAALLLVVPMSVAASDRNNPECRSMPLNPPTVTGWKYSNFKGRGTVSCSDGYWKVIRRRGPTVSVIECVTYRNESPKDCSGAMRYATLSAATINCQDWTYYDRDEKEFIPLPPFTHIEAQADMFCEAV